MATVVQENKLASVKQFNCSGCGAALEVINPRAKYIACQYCGSVLDNNSEEHQIMMSLSPPEHHKPFSFIKVGLIATFNDKKYQVIARTRWQQDYYEYWSEDGETGYSRELWVYDEWLLISEQRTYFYLVEDKKGYYISNEIIPDKPSLPSDDRYWSFMKNHRDQIIREYGAAQVVHFEGESNYQIKINDSIQFASYKHKNEIYIAEWRIDDNTNAIKEIEFFKEVKISKKEMLQAFEANEELNAIRSKGEFWQWMFLGSAASAVVCLFLMFSSFGDGDETVFSQTLELNAINDSSLILSAPIDIQQSGLHSISLEADFGANESVEAFVVTYLMDEDKNIINYLDGDFYVESGYEDGEFYVEDQVDASKIVRVENPGTYYAQFIGDKGILSSTSDLFIEELNSYIQENSNSNDADVNINGSVTMTIKTNFMLTRYFVMSFLLMSILAVVFYYQKKRFI